MLDNSLNGVGSGTYHFSEVYIISIEVVLVLDNFDRPLGCEIGEPHLGLKQPRASSGVLGVRVIRVRAPCLSFFLQL